ncbi:pyrroline-5-carboxylate reductase [Caldalkalibacillus thermarum TA2.A1]|uniref:Pyrroline-5-carboxylate reductase n=1 Tax=Caldalkalibacillus thermarum (strain TA2.A1) TaxID=986075 RepID=A0A8X8I795_CALTT|nr:pyrroline-5-carboxylate reductase [Caldalkalibacillus thermarum]QZT32837.1 pyrroline-5-carboxylate reductase [Caldalkalibacillus thermarum TA2.A1]
MKALIENKRICFVGAGAMAEAILSGLLDHKIVKPGQITVTNKEDRFRLDELVYNFGIVADRTQRYTSIQEADILILAMKPKDLKQALLDIREWSRPDQLFLSVVAGVSTATISHLLGHSAPVIRTMPNTSAVVGLSATGMCLGANVREEHVRLARTIFESIGLVFITEEEKLDAITGLSGSDPAYVYFLVEAMIKGGMDVGLSYEEARKLTLQTVLGAATMLNETGEDPAVLREKVTSPNGTTARGLEVLRRYQFEEGVRECIKQATQRSKELGQMLSINAENDKDEHVPLASRNDGKS